jgi:hypothetical protein
MPPLERNIERSIFMPVMKGIQSKIMWNRGQMTIDDPIEVQLKAIKANVEPDITGDLRGATLASTLSLIPGVGAAIQSLLDGRAKASMERRWLELFTAFGARIGEIRASIPDERYYGSEEFQTLFFLVLQQLITTQDSRKLKLLADSLANSGATPFQEDDKELYLRLIRDLSIQDISVLQDERLLSSISPDFPITYTANEIAQLSRLASMGLLIEQHISGYGGVPPPVGNDRHYQRSQLASSLLRFISDTPII